MSLISQPCPLALPGPAPASAPRSQIPWFGMLWAWARQGSWDWDPSPLPWPSRAHSRSWECRQALVVQSISQPHTGTSQPCPGPFSPHIFISHQPNPRGSPKNSLWELPLPPEFHVLAFPSPSSSDGPSSPSDELSDESKLHSQALVELNRLTGTISDNSIVVSVFALIWSHDEALQT